MERYAASQPNNSLIVRQGLEPNVHLECSIFNEMGTEQLPTMWSIQLRNNPQIQPLEDALNNHSRQSTSVYFTGSAPNRHGDGNMHTLRNHIVIREFFYSLNDGLLFCGFREDRTFLQFTLRVFSKCSGI